MTDDTKPDFDSFDYCVEFWEGALDIDYEIDHFIREAQPSRDAEEG